MSPTPPPPPPRDRRRRGASLLAATAAAAAAALVATTLAPAPAAARAPAVSWSDRDVTAGTKVTATVRADSRPRGTTLVLQRRFPDRWRTADPTARRTDDGFVLRAPTDQYGTFTYRVAAKDGSRVVSTSAQREVSVRTGYDPVGRGRQHAFSTSPRVRWDSCQTIQWTFNRRFAPPGGLRQVKQGVRRIERGTGLDFAYVGRTTTKPTPYGNNLRASDVVIGWRTGEDYRPFRRSPDTVGVGGNAYFSGYQQGDGTRVNKAVRGGVVLNKDHDPDLTDGFGRGFTWGEVIMHELGHVVGLAHPAARTQVMYYRVIRRNAEWGAGDLAGLRKVGDTGGCLTRVEGRVVVGTNREE